MNARIYIVEDHAVMRGALADFLRSTPGLEVAGAAATAEEALEEIDGDAVDLVLVDTRLPGMGGIELVEELKGRWPGVACLMLSGHDDEAYVDRAKKAGAQGYLVKGKADEIPEAIQRVLAGEPYTDWKIERSR